MEPTLGLTRFSLPAILRRIVLATEGAAVRAPAEPLRTFRFFRLVFLRFFFVPEAVVVVDVVFLLVVLRLVVLRLVVLRFVVLRLVVLRLVVLRLRVVFLRGLGTLGARVAVLVVPVCSSSSMRLSSLAWRTLDRTLSATCVLAMARAYSLTLLRGRRRRPDMYSSSLLSSS